MNDPADCPDCRGAICVTKHSRYTCKGCRRRVRWCFGAADDRPELCDDCWARAEYERTTDMLLHGRIVP